MVDRHVGVLENLLDVTSFLKETFDKIHLDNSYTKGTTTIYNYYEIICNNLVIIVLCVTFILTCSKLLYPYLFLIISLQV